jgi:phosphoribosylformylglycinamidine cyclo-ligase
MAGGETRGSGSPPMSAGSTAAGATYAGAGVDIGAGDLAVERMKGLVPGIGGFGAQFPLDTTRFTNPVLVSSTDGVGTKLAVAQATGRYDTIGLDLVAMCVDDLVCLGAEPLFMLDYIATGKVDPDRITTVVQGIQDGCRQAGCVLIGGETAEHPGVMAPDDLDIAGFAVGAVESASMLGPDRVEAGDVIIGIPSPGLRSNGYTLARHVLLERAGRSLGDPAWPGATHTLADELLLPSVIYTPAVLAVRAALDAAAGDDDSGSGLHACAHITGGGIVGNLPRVLPQGLGAVLERAAWVEPQIFVEIQRLGSVEEAEMDRVFNRGVGMALVVAAAAADAALAALTRAGLPSTVIGAVIEAQEGVMIR